MKHIVNQSELIGKTMIITTSGGGQPAADDEFQLVRVKSINSFGDVVLIDEIDGEEINGDMADFVAFPAAVIESAEELHLLKNMVKYYQKDAATPKLETA